MKTSLETNTLHFKKINVLIQKKIYIIFLSDTPRNCMDWSPGTLRLIKLRNQGPVYKLRVVMKSAAWRWPLTRLRFSWSMSTRLRFSTGQHQPDWCYHGRRQPDWAFLVVDVELSDWGFPLVGYRVCVCVCLSLCGCVCTKTGWPNK